MLRSAFWKFWYFFFATFGPLPPEFAYFWAFPATFLIDASLAMIAFSLKSIFLVF
jgi:hypothetical protein